VVGEREDVMDVETRRGQTPDASTVSALHLAPDALPFARRVETLALRADAALPVRVARAGAAGHAVSIAA
jgi:hypothetical protein